MEQETSHKTIIKQWPSIGDFAADIGVSYNTAKGIWRRGTIPSFRWAKVVSAAEKRGFNTVTYEALAKIAEQGAA